MKRSLVSYIVFLALTLIFFAFVFKKGTESHQICSIKNIENPESDTLHAMLFYHASDYFVYRGSPIGFQYDMLKMMADDLGKNITITVESDPEYAFYTCFTNEYDIVAMDINKGRIFTAYLNFSEPHSYSYPVLIAQKNTKISDNLAHELYIPDQFPVDISLSDIQTSAKWNLIYTDNSKTEDLFELLDEKKINFIASDYNLAVTLLPFYPNLKIMGRIGSDFDREWILNPHNSSLNEKINEWIVEFKRTKKYDNLCKRYLSTNSQVIRSSFGKNNRTSISNYDNIIKKYCQHYSMDWRFVSSIIYEETKFQTDMVGLGGSFGIMQIMPTTAEYYGLSDTSSVEEQIQVGIKYLSYLYKTYSKLNSEEDRLYVTAAAYNAGIGHIQDAMALSTKYETDSVNTWPIVFKYLGLKSQREYYNDPVVRCGYYPGGHSIKYATEVMDRYFAYKCVYQ